MKLGILAVMVTSVVFMGNAARAAEPREAPKADAFSVSEPRTQTLKGFTYFYASARMNFQNIKEKLTALIPTVHKAAIEAHANGTGILVLIYHGVTEDPSKDFDIEVGFPIVEKVTPVGDYKVREVAEYPCMSVLFNGSLAHLGSAYEKLIPAAMGGAAKPTGESREMYLYWEGTESPNNVVHISVGLK